MPKRGKKGVDQRVKGNVKAASSGRMADLLGDELTPGFIGFEAVSRGMGEKEGEVNGVSEEVSHSSGAKFQVVMKQLGKRDATTKIKALYEFSTLCDQEPAEAVVAVLNIWTLMYNKLSTDNDNRVREASHKALQSCVEKIKNSLGPHLRSIVGCWAAGMCDPYGSAASAAQAAFSAALTPAKQTDALKFGFKAIVSFVEDVTLRQTQDTFSDPKVVSGDERLQRYERVVTMALYGLSLTLQRLPKQFLTERQGEWETFMTEKRLWKLARHHNPYIRAACYKVVVSLCKHCGEFVSTRARQFCSLVLSSLGEKEPRVVGHLWEAALLLINLCQDWSEHVNVPKALLPGLWQLLSEGGHGSARLIYPCLPPLLTALVQQVYQSDVNFAVSFLERLKNGLQADRVRGSVSECEVVLQTFSQALTHLLLTVDTHSLGETEKQQFYRKLMSMVVELIEYGAGRCPRTQAGIVCSWVGRILDDLLEIRSSHPWIEQYTGGWLRPQLTEALAVILEKDSDKARFDQLASLLQSFSTHYSKPDCDRRVTFATEALAEKLTSLSASEEAIGEEPPSTNDSELPQKTVMERMEFVEERRDEIEREERVKERTLSEVTLSFRTSFLRPAIAGLCARCIATVVRRQSIEHCSLLSVALRLYGDEETVSRICDDDQIRCLSSGIKKVEGNGRRGEEENGEGEGERGDGEGGREGEEGGEEGDRRKVCIEGRGGGPDPCGVTEVVVYLSDCLLRAIDGKVISGCVPQLMEGVVTSILLLLKIEGVSREAITNILYQMVQDHPKILLLLLTKLGEGDGRSRREEWVKILLSRHQPLLLQLVRDGRGGEGSGGGTSREETFLWPFLDLSLTSPGSFEGTEGVEMKRSLFATLLSGVLQDCLQSGSEHSPVTERQLKTLARASANVVEDYFILKSTDGRSLLHCMLHWCLDNCRTHSPLLAAVCQAYSHLVSLLPEPASYLEATANLLTSLLVHTELDRVFEMAVTVHLLHSPALDSYAIFWSLYQSLRPSSPSDKTGFLSLGSLESFCFKRPYSPLFTDLSTDNIVTTLTGPRLTVLFLAAALCESNTLRRALESLGFDGCFGSTTSHDSRRTAFPVRDSQPQEKKSYFRLWRTTVCDVMLALCALQPSQCIQQSSTEKVVVGVLQSALEQCLVMGGDDHHHWNGQLLDELIDRASMEGPLWCQVLQQFMSALESSVSAQDRLTVLPDFVSVVLRDVEPGLVLAAVNGLSKEGQAEVEGQLMGSVRGRENDVCLLCVCLHLLPKSRTDLLSLANRSLSHIASKHSSSEITLFESVDESIQDPMVFSLLEVMSLLSAADSVPRDTWEFILCVLVTITHLTSEATEQHRSSVNYTVFYCKAMQALRDVATLLSSPLSPEQQASEWTEFFSPDIQSRLLPVFLQSATQTGSDLTSHCQRLQYYYLSCTVAEVCCTGLEGLSLDTLVDILFSPLHSFRVTAFLLAKRLVSTTQFRVEGDTTASSQENATIMTVPELRTLLSAALERVNLDLTFNVDPAAEGEEESSRDHTSSYLLIFLLLIEIMSHCGPEARASLAEWLKERTLVPHLLHGLFTVLSDSTSSPLNTHIEVTLQPDLEALCSVVYYHVARHLPSMLRQWYLSVDRWTSSAVTGYTTKNVSPALQQTELEAVGKTTSTHGNMEVRAYVGVSEVSVIYHLHEFSIELFVRLPANYPLQPPSIREGKRVKVEASQWRKWMLQLNVFVANQNGTLMDGLLLWKSNLDKHFAGIEDCMICFSVIHGSLYSLPKMTCRTCKKKFHSACLYKWFSTSNKSSCPLCRNIF